MAEHSAVLGHLPAVSDVDSRRSLVAVVERDRAKISVISGDSTHSRAELLVRERGVTLSHVKLDGAHDIVDRAIAATPEEVPRRGWNKGAGRDTHATVIVCTLGKSPILPLTIQALLGQSHQHLEVIVVDNAPATGDTRRLLAGFPDPRIRIVDEPHAGLSKARNRGLAAATGEIVVFTDDDALPYSTWLASILDVFASAPAGDVGGVTGPAFAAELQSPSQRYFEARGGFPRGLTPVVWSLGDLSGECARFGERGDGGPLFPLATARVGAGVSMAFSRPAIDALGSFDERLGAGTDTNGGEDLDAFARTLRAGFAIVYNPDAVVHHVHRRDLSGLEKQIFGNGTGMAALLTKSLLHRPWSAFVLLARLPRILTRVAPNSERMRGSEDDVPAHLSALEIRGFLRGPWRYLRECRRLRRSRSKGHR